MEAIFRGFLWCLSFPERVQYVVTECPLHQIELWQLLLMRWDWHSAVVQAMFSYLVVWYYIFELQMTITNSVTVRYSFTDWRGKGEVKVEKNILKPGKFLLKYLVGCLTAEAASEGSWLCRRKADPCFPDKCMQKSWRVGFCGMLWVEEPGCVDVVCN